MQLNLSTRATRVLAILAIALVYLITARLGLLLAIQPGFATAYWPPSGIAVAAILLYGYTIWPGIFIGSFVANLLTIDTLNIALFVSLGIAIGSTLQAAAIGYLLKKLTNSVPHLLNTRRNIASFLFFTIICCTISSTISLMTLYSAGVISGHSIGANWLTWWLGDTTGIYIYTPFLFSLLQPLIAKTIFPFKFEAIVLYIVALGIAILCFGGWLSAGYPIEYMLMPCLIWAVFRYSTPIVLTLLVFISLIAIWGTAHSFGPFARSTMNESLLLLQAFIGVLAGTTLILISAVNELWHAQKVLEEYSQELKDKVKQLNKD